MNAIVIPYNPWAVLAVLGLTVLASSGRPQDLSDVLPELKNLPAPTSIAEGLRLSYYSSVASVPPSFLTIWPDENGLVTPSASGHGYTQVDVVGLTPQVTGVNHLSGLCLPVAALARLKAGEVIDEDPVTEARVEVAWVGRLENGHPGVRFRLAGTVSWSETTFDASTGATRVTLWRSADGGRRWTALPGWDDPPCTGAPAVYVEPQPTGAVLFTAALR